MKRKIGILMLVLACLLVMAGCGCDHQWTEANCTAPKTCSLCGKTEGAPLGHVWTDATCSEPKTCSVCGATEGEALSHTWTDATCTEAKTCSVCGATEGEPLGHTWLEATTEEPQTCSVCGATEGERIITDARFTSASAAPVRGSWRCEIPMGGEDMDLEDFPGQFLVSMTFTFGPAGDVEYAMELADPDGFLSAMKTYLENMLYDSLAESDMDREAADAYMKATLGMTIPEYSEAMAKQLCESFSLSTGMVYYVDGDQLYVGESWEEELEGQTFSVEGDTLYLIEENPEDTVELKRVTE